MWYKIKFNLSIIYFFIFYLLSFEYKAYNMNTAVIRSPVVIETFILLIINNRYSSFSTLILQIKFAPNYRVIQTVNLTHLNGQS